MINRFLKEVCKELKDIGIDYIIINNGSGDFVLTTKGFSEIEEELKKSDRFRVMDRIKTMIESEFMFENTWRTVEFLDPGYFSGKKTADEFIDYVKRYRSTKRDVGYVANPEVVFFMRLVIADWEIYVQKILRDIRVGLPISLVDDVIEIANTLGIEEKMKPRVEYTKDIVKSRL